ncbi:MAG: long-chain-fatty-acid--CoA ligase [Acidobacteria bacterium]|nr:MAG: long-chain-fatty-acid--CoA ligase [Acidobacteriota bacterium]
MNFARLIDESCQGAPSSTALIIGDEQISYGELGAQIGCVASSLRRLGVQPGDRLALLMPNSFEYLVSYYALLRVGAVAVPLNPLLREPEVRYILEDCQASGLIFHQEFASIVEALRAHLSSLHHAILVGDEGQAATLTFNDLLQTGDQESFTVDSADQDLATLIYTSGMTGDPKGAMLSHRGLTASAQATIEGFRFKSTDCIIGVLPFAHIFGKNLLVQAALVAGASVVVMARFESTLVVEAIERWKATALSGVPLMLIALSNALEAQPKDISTLRKCMVGGTTVPMEVVRRFEGLFSNCEVVEAYGISENSGIVTLNPLGGGHREHSAGLPLGLNEVRVVDDQGQDVPQGLPGEIAIRGPQLLLAYWGMPEATAGAVRDGWLFTGDIGYLDEDGYLFLIDRKKDIIITSGYNVYPKEVENVLYGHPDVEAAAVIGQPDDARGEWVKAVIVLKEGATVTEDKMKEYCAGQLAAYKTPRLIEFVDDLPRTASGKILKRALRVDSEKPETSNP